jgi:3-dehydroquinate synthase
MDTLHIRGNTGRSEILVGEHLDRLEQYIPVERTVIITDHVVHDLYGERFPDCPVVTIGTGEGIKTLDTIGEIFSELVRLEADRSSVVVGIGGGIVCDVTGFAASTYMRGLRFGYVATTLLAQVDASVGGKTGVNFGGYKNMVGVFSQPDFVICDLEALNTLQPREIRCGMAEIVKHAAIADADMFAYLESHFEPALGLEKKTLQKLVLHSVETKAGVVNRDEREQGERRKLNFGHTFGHAVEKIARVAHGEAVSIGMVVAARLSAKRGMLAENDVQRLVALLENLDLPTRIDIDKQAAINAMRRDKKREGTSIHFVLLDGIGGAIVEEISIDELDSVIDSAF